MTEAERMWNLMDEVRVQLVTLLDSLSPQETSRTGSLQRWNTRDMLAHLAFWSEHFNHQLEKSLAGEKVPQAGNYHEQLNDGIWIECQSKTFEDIRAQEEAAWQRFTEIVRGFSPADLLDKERFAFLDGRSLLDRALGYHGYHVAYHISDFRMAKGEVEKARKFQESLTGQLSEYELWKANAVYNLACFFALHDLPAEALGQLKLAFAEKPELKDWARQDSDLDALRGEKEFLDLMGE